jgi:outer membrane receptor protein involved in Fe transport
MSHTKQYSISPIAAAVSAALVTPAAVLAQDERASGDTLDIIIVTATKREQNLQDIPASIQALPEAMLKEMGALNTEDYIRFMPSVNWINTNSGGNNFIVFRGVNTTTGSFTATASASVYLDEIPLTATDGSQPDIRMLDVARVEALSGPQGTLFGAAAQSGTLRIITNKPDPGKFEASVDVVTRNGYTSDPSHSISAMLNIPLVEDVFAIRFAAQSAEDGGFVDNMLGHTPDTWFGETAAENVAGGTAAPRSWGAQRLNWGNYRNDNVAEENWNSAEYINLRVSARWDINDNWSVTGAYHYGETDSQGNTGFNPFVGDLQTIRFAKDTSNSEWDMASLTIEADLEWAQLVSATSFFQNQRTFSIDNTLYYKYYMTRNYCTDKGNWADLGNAANGYFYYWLWENNVTGRAIYAPLYCVFPTQNPTGDVTQLADLIGVGEGPEWQERFTQEIRLSAQGDTFDWLAGLYYEESNDSWNSVWMKEANVNYQDSMSYAFINDCYNAAPGTPLANMWNCNAGGNFGILGGPDDVGAALQTADHYWDSRDNTDWTTKAVFGELTWHATDALNVTIGGRWFETQNDKIYIKYIAGYTGSDGRNYGGFMQPRWEGNHLRQTTTLSEFVPKFAIDYTLDDNKMVYGTYTVGYRPGGINRSNKNADWSRTLWGQEWEPDKLKNFEMGMKTRFADNTVQLNVTGFYMQWDDYIHQTVDPSSNTCVVPSDPFPACPGGELPWISIVGNVGDAHILGLTTELDWVPADGWAVGGNLQWLEAEMDTTHPRSGIAEGQRTPNNAEWQGAAWATYTWPVQFIPGAEMFVRGQASYTGETLTQLVPSPETSNNPSFTNDAYTIADLRVGLVSPDGGWQVDLFINNLTDERAQIQRGGGTGAWQWGRSGEYERSHILYTVRPREYGLRFTARWGD